MSCLILSAQVPVVSVGCVDTTHSNHSNGNIERPAVRNTKPVQHSADRAKHEKVAVKNEPAPAPDQHEPFRILRQIGASIRLSQDGRILTLSLAGIRGTDRQMNMIGQLTSLQVLNLDGTDITDRGLAHVSGLVNLRILRLNRTSVTDAGLENLRGLSRLRRLVLDHTSISDAGLEHLKRLRSLETLHLRDTRVSKRGATMLWEALPKCDFHGQFGLPARP